MSTRKRKHSTRNRSQRYRNDPDYSNSSNNASTSGSYNFDFSSNNTRPTNDYYEQAQGLGGGGEGPTSHGFVPDPVLFIQAHEAEIIRGPSGRVAAESLEVKVKKRTPKEKEKGGDKLKEEWVVGNGLIRWGGDAVVRSAFLGDDDDEGAGTQMDTSAGDGEGVWVDRYGFVFYYISSSNEKKKKMYDVRLLLDTLPVPPPPHHHHQNNPNPNPTPRPTSPSGWTDLPSDSEDTFFLSPDEIDDYHREKRRKVMEQSREARLKARMAEDGETGGGGDDDDATGEGGWGGSDEEPDEPQKELMRRTARHVLLSPNPAQLEMRILANHGGDKRFAFLRGRRWKRSWEIVKGLTRIEIGREKEKEKEKEKEEEREKEEKGHGKGTTGLGLLGDYGDSEDDSETGDGEDDGNNSGVEEGGSAKGEEDEDEDEAVKKEARRARAKEWMAQRRASALAKQTEMGPG